MGDDMENYNFDTALDYMNAKYSAVLRSLSEEQVKQMETNVLLGASFSDLLPLTETTPLKTLLLVSLALEERMGDIHLLKKSTFLMNNERFRKDYKARKSDWEEMLEAHERYVEDNNLPRDEGTANAIKDQIARLEKLAEIKA